MLHMQLPVNKLSIWNDFLVNGELFAWGHDVDNTGFIMFCKLIPKEFLDLVTST